MYACISKDDAGDKHSQGIRQREWNIVAQGNCMTHEFEDFKSWKVKERLYCSHYYRNKIRRCY